MVSSAEAIISGLSPDGGLFVPESLPCFTMDDIACLTEKDYIGRAVFVLSKFLTDFSPDELYKYASIAYSKEKFSHEAVAPVVPLDETASILELFHGPTCAFKDLRCRFFRCCSRPRLKKPESTKP